MDISGSIVKKIAHLARLYLTDKELAEQEEKLGTILTWVEQLSEVNTDGVEPMTSVVEVQLRWRKDEITDGGCAERVIKNAPESDDGFFTVPKVLE